LTIFFQNQEINHIPSPLKFFKKISWPLYLSKNIYTPKIYYEKKMIKNEKYKINSNVFPPSRIKNGNKKFTNNTKINTK
jgi:hypothetical protein